jgi:putative transposase
MSVKTAPWSATWSAFVRNHASAVLACDFFVAITATFRVLHVFVVLDVCSRRILHWNVTEHPTADWTAQQFRMVVLGDEPYRFVIHERDSIFYDRVDRTIMAMGLTVLKTPAQSPQANAFCERLIGTIRRECLDWLIPLNDGSPPTPPPAVGCALQRRAASYEPGTRHSGSLGQ